MRRRNADADYLPLFDAPDRRVKGATSAESPPAPASGASGTGDRVDETQAKHEQNGGSVTVDTAGDANRAFLEAASEMEE